MPSGRIRVFRMRPLVVLLVLLQGSGLLAHGLHGEVDVHLVPDEDAATVERDVEVHAEVLAVDDAVGLEAETLAAPRVLADAEELDLELDRAGDALEGQVADDGDAVERGGGEAHLAELLHVEEVRGAQVPVALLVAGVHGVQVDGGCGTGLLQGGPGGELALEGLELPTNLAHQVTDGEPDLGVARVDLPGTGGDVGAEGGVNGDGHVDQSSGLARCVSRSRGSREFNYPVWRNIPAETALLE